MDVAVKNLLATAFDQSKKHQGPYKREYQRIGQAFCGLGQAFEEPKCKIIFIHILKSFPTPLPPFLCF